MKQLFISLFAIALVACNNDNTKAGNNKEGERPASSSSADVGSGSCSKLVLFKKGTILEGRSYDAAGKVTGSQTTTVTETSEDAGVMTAHCTISSGTAKPINLTYKCDGGKLSVDVSSLLQNFASMKQNNTEINAMQFPLDMKEGETLPETSFSMDMDRGAMKMKITIAYKDRKVVAKEKITTEGGSWDCYKITSKADAEISGVDEQMKAVMDAMKKNMQMDMTMWFHPEIGIVRVEILKNGVLSSRSDVVGVK